MTKVLECGVGGGVGHCDDLWCKDQYKEYLHNRTLTFLFVLCMTQSKEAHTNARTRRHRRTHARTHARTHTHTHTYTHTHCENETETKTQADRHAETEKQFVACLTSKQHASVSQGRICSDNFTCCHTEIEVADPTFYLTQSQYTDTGPTSPSTDPITSGAWQGSHWSTNF